jgi:hypothetical protein
MAYFDAFTANLFRTDIRGRRVICPFGRRVYAVAPGDERRIKRAVKWFHAAMLVLVVVVTSAVMPNWLWLLLLVPLLVAANFLLMALLARTLVPLEVGRADLAPVTPLGALDETARATGRRTLWTLTLLSSALTALGLWVRLWWGAAFFALCTAIFVVQLWRLRRS